MIAAQSQKIIQPYNFYFDADSFIIINIKEA